MRPRLPAASSARRSTTSTTGGAPVGRVGKRDPPVRARHAPGRRTRPTAWHCRGRPRRPASRPSSIAAARALSRGVRSLLYAPSCSSSTTTRPRSASGASTARRVPTTIGARPGPDAPPLVGPFAFAEARVDEGDLGVELGPQAIDERQREGDLRDEDEGRPAGLERRDDRLDVDRGLPAAGDAVEERAASGRAPRSPGAIEPDRLGLGRREGRRPPAAPLAGRRRGPRAAAARRRPWRPRRARARTRPRRVPSPCRSASSGVPDRARRSAASSARRATWRGPRRGPVGLGRRRPGSPRPLARPRSAVASRSVRGAAPARRQRPVEGQPTGVGQPMEAPEEAGPALGRVEAR